MSSVNLIASKDLGVKVVKPESFGKPRFVKFRVFILRRSLR